MGQPSIVAFEKVCKTILKVADPTYQDGSGQNLAEQTCDPQALESMQRLIDVIHTLRLAVTSLPDEPFPDRGDPPLPLTPETMIPYLSEEAYDVMDALERGTSAGQNSDAGNPFPTQIRLRDQLNEPILILMETLVPRLLWCVVRGGCRVMQLLEGVAATQRQPDQSWLPGMLRLVALVELVAPEITCCFDLATGSFPGKLLGPEEVLQADESIFGMLRSPQFPSSVSDSAVLVKTQLVKPQLEALTEQIKTATPALLPFFEGISVSLLPPGQGWQMGELRLRLGFEFVPGQNGAIANQPSQPFGAEALVRLTHPLDSNCDPQSPESQWLAGAIARLRRTIPGQDPENDLLSVIQAACAIADIPPQDNWRLGHAQPALLIDQLFPRLLWHITRSSYSVMQLMGGVEADVLQPGRNWQRGILRLLASLQILAPGIDCTIDLATGHLAIGQNGGSTAELLHPDAICQLPYGETPGALFQPIPCFSQPLRIEELLHSLQQQIQTTDPELTQLKTGATKLGSEQDWQQATFSLAFGVEFIAVTQVDGSAHIP